MKAAIFEYARADSIAQACSLLAEHGADAKLLAGGQSLVPMMAMRLARPAWLINVNEIAELKSSRRDGAAWVTGAGLRQVDVERDGELVAASFTPTRRRNCRWSRRRWEPASCSGATAASARWPPPISSRHR